MNTEQPTIPGEDSNMSGHYRKRLFLACFTTGVLVSCVCATFDYFISRTVDTRRSQEFSAASAETNLKLLEMTQRLAELQSETRTNVAAIVAERDDFRNKYLREYDTRKALKANFDKSARLVEKIRSVHKISTAEILNMQLCTCPNTEPCWQGNLCDYPSCPVCLKLKQQAEAKKAKGKSD